MAAWDKWQKDTQGREIISGYEMKLRRKHVRWCVEQLAEVRTACLIAVRQRRWLIDRENSLWAYLTARRDLARAREAVSMAVVAKAPNASPYQRARRGFDALPETLK